MTAEVGWMVTDPQGNVVASGPVTKAQPSGEVAQMLEED